MYKVERRSLRGAWIAMVILLVTWLGATATEAGSEAEVKTPGPSGTYKAYQATDPRSWDPSELRPEDDPTGVVTLDDALRLALAHNPVLAALAWSHLAAEAQLKQSRALPNPEVDMEAEEFGGTGEMKEFDSATITLQVSQLIEIGGKRSSRGRLASAEMALAAWEYEIGRLDVVTETSRRFASVLAAQERLELANDELELQEATLSMVSRRVAAGKDAPAAQTQAEISQANARIHLERSKRSLAIARDRLTAMWGGEAPGFDRAGGELREVIPPPGENVIIDLVSQSPEVARQAHETELRQAVLNLEKANRIPDLTLSGGIRRFYENDDQAYVAAVSLPFPIFDRNGAAVKAARCGLVSSKAQGKATEAEVRSELISAMHSLSSAYLALQELEAVVLPAAQSTVAAVLEGYRSGKFSYLRVLEAQRTQFEARGEYVGALEDYHTSRAEVERLIGADLDSLPATENE